MDWITMLTHGSTFAEEADKENLRTGIPVVKSCDVKRVKRNLSAPLKPKNVMSPSTNALLPNDRCINSPVTELAHNFTELAAHENTPKRRLSLASSGSPTPDNLCKAVNYSHLTTAKHSSSGTDWESPALQAANIEDKLSQNSAFRRYKSVPYEANEASPQLDCPMLKTAGSVKSPLASQSVSHTSFYIGEHCSPDSQDSGLGKEEPFQFIAPLVPPQKTQQENELSPCHSQPKSAVSHVIGSADFSDYTAQDHHDSPLLAHRLCSQSDDQDDGFLDFYILENQPCDDVPDSIAPMLTGKLTVPQQTLTKKSASPNKKATFFRSPSLPGGLGKKATLFDIRRRVVCFKRPEPPRDNNTPVSNKRRRAVQSDGDMLNASVGTVTAARLQRCKSMVEHSATFALTKTDSGSELTGDFSRECCLPLIAGRHQDLKSISVHTMAGILRKDYNHILEQCTIIDCRYPYEYEGGHIKGALNIYTKDDIYTHFLEHAQPSSSNRSSILIFHCEFSSERAPKLSRFLRNKDRSANDDNYPSLHYPEVYLLGGGYKAFYEAYKELCTPCSYKPMLHKDHSNDLKTFRAKSKSWAGGEKRGVRPGLKW